MTDAAEPPFRSLAIAGLGLIGGSIALALREHWPQVRVTGIDTEAVIAHVRGSGVIDRSAGSLADVDDVELVVLAAPIGQNVELLETLTRATPARPRPVVITDVGGTKRAMTEAARALAGPAVFVGGHPLGGAEHGGFAYARPDLFQGRPWIFTPTGDGALNATERLRRLVAGFGAEPVTMTAEAHDEVMALVSHLPQLVASALMDVVGAEAGAGQLRLAGRGLVDTTRLASSPADIWQDVCRTNADAIGPALDRVIARLQELRDGLEQPEVVAKLFADASRWRAELLKHRG